MSSNRPNRARSLPDGRVSSSAKMNPEDVVDIKRLISTIQAERKAATTTKPANKTTSSVSAFENRKSGNNNNNNNNNNNKSSRTASSISSTKMGDGLPALATTTSSTTSSSSSSSALNVDAYAEDETLIRVRISSSLSDQEFHVPVALIVSRELEMREAAKTFGIGKDRWKRSLLFREWQHHDHESAIVRLRQDPQKNGEWVLPLFPETECASTNHSHSFVWTPWLTTCLRAYYNTGMIGITDACTGSDILLALEYFGIVYRPDQLVFDSFGAYMRVRLWSDYYTHRSQLAQWVMHAFLHTNNSLFCAHPQPNQTITFQQERVVILDGDLKLDPSRYEEPTPNCAAVYGFFHEGVSMRQDFASYVRHSLQGMEVSFAMQTVTVDGKEQMERAVLRLRFHKRAPPPPPPNHMETIDGKLPSSDGSSGKPKLMMLRRVASLGLRRNRSSNAVTNKRLVVRVEEEEEEETTLALEQDHYLEVGSKRSGHAQPSPPPSVRHVNADLDKRTQSAPSDERNHILPRGSSQELSRMRYEVPMEYYYPGVLPMKDIHLADGTDAVSVLTGEFKDDDAESRHSLPLKSYTPLFSSSDSDQHATAPEFATPIETLVHKEQVQQQPPPQKQQSVVMDQDARTIASSKVGSVRPHMCVADMLPFASLCLAFGWSDSSKTEQQQQQQQPAVVEEDKKAPSLFSRVEGLLPEVDLRSETGTAPSHHSQTLDDFTSAWLRDAFSLSRYIYDDPVPTDQDEYLQMARQAGEQVDTIPTPGNPTRVKDILDHIMDLDIYDVNGEDQQSKSTRSSGKKRPPRHPGKTTTSSSDALPPTLPQSKPKKIVPSGHSDTTEKTTNVQKLDEIQTTEDGQKTSRKVLRKLFRRKKHMQ